MFNVFIKDVLKLSFKISVNVYYVDFILNIYIIFSTVNIFIKSLKCSNKFEDFKDFHAKPGDSLLANK